MKHEPEEFEKQFLETVVDQKIEIINDDGINRCINFVNPNSINNDFSIITWQHHLVIAGDLGTYVFKSGEKDLINLVRLDVLNLSVDESYWSRRLVATSLFGSSADNTHKELDIEKTIHGIATLMHSNILDVYKDCYECSASLLIDNSLCPDCSIQVHSIKKELINCKDVSDVHKLCTYYDIDNWYDELCYTPTQSFLNCLYAIIWGIQEYDKYKGLDK